MLETIVARQVVFYLVGAVIAIGIIAKLIAGISLKRLVRAASNMSKSNHALMRLVRAKFEHACMVSDKVQNVRAFVEKYVYEYRVMGLRLHSWRRLEKSAIWFCALVSAAGAGISYYVNGLDDMVYQYGIVGAAGTVGLFLIHIMMDEQYQLEAAKTYMVDFLENTYAHRYEKTNQREIQVTVQRTEEAIGQSAYMADSYRPEMPPQRDPMIQPENIPIYPEDVPVQEPYGQPPSQPTGVPVQEPYSQPSSQPTGVPVQEPYSQPSSQPTGVPVQELYSRPVSGEKPASGERPINGERPMSGERPINGERPMSGERQSIGGRQMSGERQCVEDRKPAGGRRGVRGRQMSGENKQSARERQVSEGGQARPEVQAASSGCVQASGNPQNAVRASEYENMSWEEGQESRESQDFQKEARIREILEEFLA